MLANAPRAARQNHVPLHLQKWQRGRRAVRRAQRFRPQCSQSSEAWQAAADADWGNAVQKDAESKRNRNIWASLMLVAGVAFAFVVARIAWTDSMVGTTIHQPAQPATSETGSKTSSNSKQEGKEDGQPLAHQTSIPTSSHEEAAAASVLVEQPSSSQDLKRDAPDEADVPDTQPESESNDGPLTDRTQEPLLQNLFEDLEQRPADTDLHTQSLSRASGSGRQTQVSGMEEPADDLAVRNSDIDKLDSLSGHDQLQQRAALAVRAAQAALCACENASAHSAASCRSAAEAASAANIATRAASQALSSADRLATEDLERALRRVQHAQQQARDAEAAAATAATNASAQADIATEQARLAQQAATPQEEPVVVKQNFTDKIKTWAASSKAVAIAWIQTFCAWCSQAWQAFLAWTSRVGEHVQRLISRQK